MSPPQLLLHAATVLLLPPLLLGVIGRTKAVFAGRRGAPILQPWFDLLKLARKDTVLSTTTTWVFLAGPAVGLAAVLVASLLLPLGAPAAPLSFAGDLVLFAGLLGLARLFTVLAALDTGSSFEGMGAAREATFSALAEPALLLGLFAVARTAGSTSLAGMLGAALPSPLSVAGAPLILVGVGLLIVLLAENSRIPFDDPTTHLELTMVHEVMVLDHSGPALGMALYGAAIKLFLFVALLVRLFLPFGVGDPRLDPLLFASACVGVAVLIGVVESTVARSGLLQVPRMLVSACLLTAFGLVLLAR